MNKLDVRMVPFEESSLLAAQDENGVIWAGIRWMCDGIGLNEDQRRRQIKNAQSDIVISQGVSNLTLLTNGGMQSVICLRLDYVPLWLAKISITPKMKKESPDVVDRLVEYQLKAKDVLANAFLQPLIPPDYPSALRALADEIDKNSRLQEVNDIVVGKLELAEPKAEYYDAFVHTKTSSNFRTTAKEIGVGERKLIKLLLDKRFLYRDQQGDLLPYAEKNRDYFIVRDVASNRWMGKQTYITEKGKQHFRKLCVKAGLVKGEMDTALPVLPAQS